jgi:hypothetical protein
MAACDAIGSLERLPDGGGRSSIPLSSIPHLDAGTQGTDDAGTSPAATCTVSQLFQAATIDSVGSGPYGIAVADFNQDGHPDLAVVDSVQDAVWVLLGNGDGTFGEPVSYLEGGGAWSVTQADFNGDGIPDLATANSVANTMSILIGDGKGGFAAPQSYAAGRGPNTVLARDLNGDGVLDVVVSNYGDSTVNVLLGQAGGGFANAVAYDVGNGAIFVVAADLTGDGIPDLLAASQGQSTLTLLPGTGDGTFSSGQLFGAGAGDGPTSIALGDFNGDGSLDAAVTDWYGNSTAIITGPPSSTTQPSILAMGSNPNSVAVADFDGDGNLDLAVAEANGFSSDPPGTVDLLLGNGDGTFTSSAQLSVGAGPVYLTAVDLNGDGKPDLAVADISGSVSILLNGCP